MSPTKSAPLEQLPALPRAFASALAEANVNLRTRPTDRLAAAHDASHYRLVPGAVATPTSTHEVAAVLAAAHRESQPVTFRSGGTSLSGQGLTTGLLVDTRTHFRAITVLDGGARVRSGPGATVRAVNQRLTRHGFKLGPDPASEVAATVGGVVANNSSGMACGITDNTYRTLDSSVLVLPSGTVIDTSVDTADALLAEHEPDLHAGLAQLRDELRADPQAVATIRALFAIKNTMGYAINSFVDYDRPVDILEHLVVGSEGTLAFVAEATFRTVPLKPHAATALLVFADLVAATDALGALVEAGCATIELLDATSLRVSQRDPAATADLLALEVDAHAALLVEIQEADRAALAARSQELADVIAQLPLVSEAGLTQDPARRAALWNIRKGLFTLVAGNRPSGTSALLEDIAVPVERLGQTCQALTTMFDEYGYEDSAIFGHAKDGNIHFLLNERFDDPASLKRYQAFTEAMVDLVLSHGGTLKAEHGTGRIMAPYVRRQYGDRLYDVMKRIKALTDPRGILNPGVILNDDPNAHVRDLKVALPVEEEVDRCVECGYCEPVCPSKDLTLTPRERIVLRRELADAEAAGNDTLAKQLRKEFKYDGLQTCAVDGMCQTACPVLINTGDLVRRLRLEGQGGLTDRAWGTAAKHWDATTRVASVALTTADALPAVLPTAATRVARAVAGAESVPAYSKDLPRGGPRRPSITSDQPVAVYFSSCMTTMFGAGVQESFARLCERAGVAITTPPDLPSLCCGTPWQSKGLASGYESMTERVTQVLLEATRGGELPVVSDAASCTEGLAALLEAAGAQGIRVVDAVEFVATHVLSQLPEGERIEKLVIHPTCSSTRLGINDSLTTVARAVAEEVQVPDDWGCCAYAGDRGMLHPELTESATARQAEQVNEMGAQAHASLNRACEMGMSRATGETYRHVLELLDEATSKPSATDT